ncbi:hypothetical protein [Acidiphilium sp.]|uniref:hypothetical protein n=1 Tax=Acidiphilium sp. TaxID=527 RepID=UPI00258B849D|nr:hypothetical protein [Acidiphilium sp.]
MNEPAPQDIVFNLSAFRRRASALVSRMKVSPVTVSKRLFNGHAHALPHILDEAVPDDEKTFPRLDTLLKAEKALTELEGAGGAEGR